MDGLPKVSIGIIGVVILQIGGFIWWTAQQASTISNLESTVSQLSAQSEVQDKVNMQRDILANSMRLDDIDEDLDDLMQPEPGHSRVFSVPRINQCISSKFISFMNRFGNAGGFDALLELGHFFKTGSRNLTTNAQGLITQNCNKTFYFPAMEIYV